MSLLKAGRIEIVAAVVGFDGPDVLLGDGARIQPEVVIAATGYRRGLEPLVGHFGVLDEDGIPLAEVEVPVTAGESESVSLYGIGLGHGAEALLSTPSSDGNQLTDFGSRSG